MRSPSCERVSGPSAASARSIAPTPRSAAAGSTPSCARRRALAGEQRRRGQGVQPGVVLGADEVQRSAVEPRDQERALVRERPVDVGGAEPGRTVPGQRAAPRADPGPGWRAAAARRPPETAPAVPPAAVRRASSPCARPRPSGQSGNGIRRCARGVSPRCREVPTLGRGIDRAVCRDHRHARVVLGRRGHTRGHQRRGVLGVRPGLPRPARLRQRARPGRVRGPRATCARPSSSSGTRRSTASAFLEARFGRVPPADRPRRPVRRRPRSATSELQIRRAPARGPLARQARACTSSRSPTSSRRCPRPIAQALRLLAVDPRRSSEPASRAASARSRTS